eukprot:3866987-Ditylum_brightwellii.AAC.1
MQRQGENHPNPRKKWNEDMKKFLNYIPKEDNIVVLTDITGQANDNNVVRLLAETGLYDLMTMQHSEYSPATYMRGTKAVNHIFGTEKIVKAVGKVGMVEF